MKPMRAGKEKPIGTKHRVGKEQLVERIDTRRIYKDERQRLKKIKKSKRRLRKSERQFLTRLYRDLKHRLSGSERRRLEAKQRVIFNRLSGIQSELLLRTKESDGNRDEKKNSPNLSLCKELEKLGLLEKTGRYSWMLTSFGSNAASEILKNRVKAKQENLLAKELFSESLPPKKELRTVVDSRGVITKSWVPVPRLSSTSTPKPSTGSIVEPQRVLDALMVRGFSHIRRRNKAVVRDMWINKSTGAMLIGNPSGDWKIGKGFPSFSMVSFRPKYRGKGGEQLLRKIAEPNFRDEFRSKPVEEPRDR